MPVLYLMEFCCGIMILMIIVTQIIMPFFSGTPIFPALQRHGLEAKLEQAKQEVRIARLENQIDEIRKEAENIRQKEGEK